MSCEITDLWISADDETATPIEGAMVAAAPVYHPIFIEIDGEFREVASPERSTTTGVDGAWSILLPRSSEQDPASTRWQITLPDGKKWVGVPPDAAGPLTIYDLKNDHGWKLVVADAPFVKAIAGPPGPAGATGPTGPAGPSGGSLTGIPTGFKYGFRSGLSSDGKLYLTALTWSSYGPAAATLPEAGDIIMEAYVIDQATYAYVSPIPFVPVFGSIDGPTVLADGGGAYVNQIGGADLSPYFLIFTMYTPHA